MRRNRRALPRRRWNSPLAPVLHALDLGAEGAKALIDALVAALDLTDVVDHALPLCAKRGEQNGHTRSDIGGLHIPAAELRGTDDDRAVRIAENDSSTHADQLVDEEHARLEHL